MNIPFNQYLAIAAVFNIIVSVLHVAIILFGASWYRFFGAGEKMVRLSESGSWYPNIVTFCIATILFVWGCYALSGAGLISLLPITKLMLGIITLIYLVRGITPIPILIFLKQRVTPFWCWSSAICLLFGIIHLVGFIRLSRVLNNI